MKMKFLLLATIGLCSIFTLGANGDPNNELFTACRQGDLDGTKKALASGADPNALDENGNSALGNAFLWPKITEALISAGADPNAGAYPAIVSASNNYSVEVVDLLIKAGADPNKPGMVDPGAGLRKMLEAEKAKGKKANKATVEAWEAALANMKPSKVYALQVTVQASNCAQCIDKLIKAGADQKTSFPDGSAFHTFAAFGMSRAQRKEAFAAGKPNMEAYGLKVPDWYGDLPDDVNSTAEEVAKVLKSGGADPNAKNSSGQTPIIVSLSVHKLEVSKALLAVGAKADQPVMVKSVTGELPAHPICKAAEFVDVATMETILSQGADINASTDAITLSMVARYKGAVNFGGDGYTPLIIAIMFDQMELAKYLMSKDPNIKIGSNGTSIVATKYEELNCPVQIKNKTPIYWAVEHDDMELIEMIGKKMEWKFNPDFTIKQYSAGGGSKDMGGYVLKCASFKTKQSPSSYANQIGNKEASKFLVSKGL